MKSYRDRFILGLVVAGVILLCAVITFQYISEGIRRQAVKKNDPPAAIIRYQELHERHAAAARAPQDAVSEQSAPPSPEDNFAVFGRYFMQLDDRSSEQGWTDFHDLLEKKPVHWSKEEWTKADQFVGENQELIVLIRRLAELGGPVYPLDFSKGFELELPHLAKLREGARLLVLDAIAKANGGETETAVADILAGMKLGDALADEPILISQLVRVGIQWRMYEGVQDAFPPGVLTADQTREIIRYARQAGHREAFTEGLAGERYFGLEGFSDVRNGESPIPGESGNNRPAWNAYGSFLLRPWLNLDEAAYADIMNQFIETSQKPFFEARPALVTIEGRIDSLPRTRVLTRIIMPELTRANEAQAQLEARLGLLQIGLELEQRFTETGNYPDNLAGLTSAVDPFTGEPYRYANQGTSFTLYSVGRNLVDDGGRPDAREGDMVWRGVEE